MIESYKSSTESSKESDKDSSDESSTSKKKSQSKAGILGGLTAEKVISPPSSASKSERAQTIWQKLAAFEDAKKPARATTEIVLGVPDTSGDKTVEKVEKTDGGEFDDSEADSTLEKLTPQERHEAVQDYVDHRTALLRQEGRDQPAEQIADGAESPSDETREIAQTAETAANLALLQSIRQELAQNPDRPVEEVLDAAEASALQQIDGSEASESAPADQEDHLETEAVAETQMDIAGPTDESNTAEIRLHAENAPNNAGESAEDTTVIIDRSNDGSATSPAGPAAQGSGSNGNMPPGPPLPPLPPLSPPSPLAGGPGGMPYPGGGPNFNAAPANAYRTEAVPSVRSGAGNERRAVAQGLLVGGIVGYLVGRRRGRIKTEKRLLPVQQKLEKEVTALHAAVAEKEQKIRRISAEKAQALATPAERRQFVERIARPATTRAEEASAVREQIPVAVASERAGRRAAGAAEAPVILLGAAAASLLRPERGAAPESAETPRSMIDFSKKVEAYSAGELSQAAEKIRVDGVSLKELRDTNRLDENALRRVVTEFVEGGSVRAALGKELLEKELRYERDPKMRQAASAQGGTSGTGNSSGGSGGSDDVAVGSDTNGADGLESGSAAGMTNGKRPTPDKATLDKLRKKQMTELAVASTTVVTFFTIVIALLL